MVNKDIAPGTWRSDGSGACYWERLRGFSGDMDAIIANDNTNGSTVVTIAQETQASLAHGVESGRRLTRRDVAKDRR